MKKYGWQVKEWHFNSNNIEQKRIEMIDWCKKNKSKYQIQEIFINNSWAVEYKPLLQY